jgi:hypothetical protein
MTAVQQVLRRDFSATTLRALSKRGVQILGVTLLPGAGDMPYANGERGYVVNDNDCGRVLTFRQVTKLAGVA